MPGVKIGKGSVIGAGAVVSKDIPSFSVAVGNPIRVVKTRNIKYPYRLPGGDYCLLDSDTIAEVKNIKKR